MGHKHFLYHGHCAECNRRHIYDGTGVYIPGSDDLKLDRPIECDCGELLHTLGLSRGKKFFSEANSEYVYFKEQRPVPFPHQTTARYSALPSRTGGKSIPARGPTEQEERSAYWRVNDQREANARFAAQRSPDQDTMRVGELPTEKHIRVSDHPVMESVGIVLAFALGILGAVYIWGLLLH